MRLLQSCCRRHTARTAGRLALLTTGLWRSTAAPLCSYPPVRVPHALTTSFRSCSTSGPPPPEDKQTYEEAVFPAVQELLLLLTRAYRIGDLYQRLSPPTKELLTRKLKVPLEKVLYDHPQHFVVYRRFSATAGAKRRSPALHVAPPYLVPPGSKVVSGNIGHSDTCVSTPSHRVAVQPETDFDAGNMLTRDKVREVLKYIPDAFTEHLAIEIPYHVKTTCMGYPEQSQIDFYRKHARYFEVHRPEGAAGNIYYVRRSAWVQEMYRQQQQNRAPS
ncbi:hypothetical protein AGDE_13551 [Angomonas deanei]|uniref:Uncharacterized protein n=1 Tax=Angomonas deanei TaxID=59799 RepID=A0A7G2CC25_9TRYP|nr:hypothetical protein AGDE_13551 [Angomonas deanei]CAD2217366.1 hypothetical protein, conserved [Angomonas deanei]|eukprot:EPY22186.1 hypothetical protein AGDE_13551 [Angomonas deanei]